MEKVVAIIEARMTSSRLPGKVLMEAAGKPMLQILVERLQSAETLDGIVVATTIRASDDPIESLCNSLGASVEARRTCLNAFAVLRSCPEPKSWSKSREIVRSSILGRSIMPWVSSALCIPARDTSRTAHRREMRRSE